MRNKQQQQHAMVVVMVVVVMMTWCTMWTPCRAEETVDTPLIAEVEADGGIIVQDEVETENIQQPDPLPESKEDQKRAAAQIAIHEMQKHMAGERGGGPLGENMSEEERREEAAKAFKMAEETIANRTAFNEQVEKGKDATDQSSVDDKYKNETMILERQIVLNKKIIKHLRISAKYGHSEGKYEIASILFAGAEQFQRQKIAERHKKLQALQGNGDLLTVERLKGEIQMLELIGKNDEAFEKGVVKVQADEDLRQQHLFSLVQELQKSHKEALKWIWESANEGFPKAMFECGVIRLQGQGPIKKNASEAVRLLEGASSGGHVGATAMLGELYLTGNRAENGEFLLQKNYKLARKYLSKAVRKNNADAMDHLAKMYCDGLGVKRNNTRCFKLAAKASRRGHMPATQQLAWMYHNGKGVKKDQKKFIELLELAAHNGFPDAAYDMGMNYLQATVVEENVEKAKEWFTKAAQKGHVESQYNLGVAALNEERFEYAYQRFVQAANRGFAAATYNLGLMFQHGHGMKEPDLEQAKYYFKLAHDQGFRRARDRLLKLGSDPDQKSA